jgi:hypothetical protein
MVTHSSTSRPVQCLCMAERTGCPVFTDLWSYVLIMLVMYYIKLTFVRIVLRRMVRALFHAVPIRTSFILHTT